MNQTTEAEAEKTKKTERAKCSNCPSWKRKTTSRDGEPGMAGRHRWGYCHNEERSGERQAYEDHICRHHPDVERCPNIRCEDGHVEITGGPIPVKTSCLQCGGTGVKR